MTFTAQYANAEQTVVTRSDMPGASIPVDPGNRHYDEIIDAGVVIADYVPPASSTDPVDYPLESYQFETMLERLGKVQAVEDAINAIADPNEQSLARAKRRFPPGGTYNRADPLFDQLLPGVGMTAEELDAAWMVAKDL